MLALVAGLASRGGLAEVSSAEEGEDQQSAPQTGTVIKGPLSGALVFADQNSNGQFDDGEPNTIKDENGDYSLPPGSQGSETIALTDQNTIDTGSGTMLDGLILKAPVGASVKVARRISCDFPSGSMQQQTINLFRHYHLPPN